MKWVCRLGIIKLRKVSGCTRPLVMNIETQRRQSTKWCSWGWLLVRNFTWYLLRRSKMYLLAFGASGVVVIVNEHIKSSRGEERVFFKQIYLTFSVKQYRWITHRNHAYSHNRRASSAQQIICRSWAYPSTINEWNNPRACSHYHRQLLRWPFCPRTLLPNQYRQSRSG